MTSITTADVTSLADSARTLLRDFPEYFEVTLPTNPRPTIKLPHPMISSIEVWDIANDQVVGPDNWAVDNRNGILKLSDNRSAFSSAGVHIQGFHFEWFLTEDLAFYSSYVINEHLFEREDAIGTFDDFSAVEQNVMAKGTVVMALMALMSEFATQIDVSSPEGMMIPAHMRFQQVQALWQYWSKQYEEDAAMLNVGMDRMSMRTLRRVAKLTNRLVPLFETQEVDDPRPPMRAFPPIPPISPDDQQGVPGTSYLGEVGIGSGWDTLGQSGG